MGKLIQKDASIRPSVRVNSSKVNTVIVRHLVNQRSDHPHRIVARRPPTRIRARAAGVVAKVEVLVGIIARLAECARGASRAGAVP
eukprot:6184690-Pleurochrysis_carterae.AAC.1